MDNHQKKDEGFKIDEQQAGFVMGAVMGALVGGAAALLLSPKSGKEMREVVKKYSKELEKEAHELAKDARGTAGSFKSVLQEGATEVLEQAPDKIEQAGYQAQQLADELNQRFESARDVVTELAEAFRSGWEEYGEDQPEDELKAAPSLLEDDVVEPAQTQSEEASDEVEVVQKPILSSFEDLDEEEGEEIEKVPPVVPTHARRRTHTSSSYSMHSTDVSPEVAEPTPAEARHETPKNEEQPEHKKPATQSYTTRVLDEPKKVLTVKPQPKTDASSAKKAAEPKKKLLFRRSK